MRKRVRFKPGTTLAEKFWFFVSQADVDAGGCWMWRGQTIPLGYGRLSHGGPLQAHRVAYEILVGPIPEGLTIDHLCRVPGCVNPAHLEPVTASENLRRRHAAVTHCPQGHEYTAENTYQHRGSRYCKACTRERKLIENEAQKRKRHPLPPPRYNPRHGTTSPMASMTEDMVREARARRATGETYAAIAATLGVKPDAVSRATRGQSYKNVA